MHRAAPTRRHLFRARRWSLLVVLVPTAAACGGGRTADLSIHYRQLPDGGLGAVGQHGRNICRRESDVDRIRVTVDSIPPDDTMPREFVWTCEELERD